MKTNYHTYKIKPKDTLASIAKELGLDINELKAYHNQRTELYGQIKQKLPYFLQEIYVPPKGYGLKNGKEVWLDNSINEPDTLNEPFFGKLNRVHTEKSITYEVLKVITTGNKKLTIKYQVCVQFYKLDYESNNFVSIDIVSKTYINNKEPDLIAEEMAMACSKALYPIEFKINTNGLLQDIQNHEEILKRWKKQKEENLRYFKGKVAENYMNLFEQNIKSKEKLFDSLQKDWFYKTYFNDIYTVYGEGFNINVPTDFPILPHQENIIYTVDRTATIFLKSNRLKIQINGSNKNKNTTENSKGKYNAIYNLSQKNHVIDFAYVCCNINSRIHKSAIITITKIKEEASAKKVSQPQFLLELES